MSEQFDRLIKTLWGTCGEQLVQPPAHEHQVISGMALPCKASKTFKDSGPAASAPSQTCSEFALPFSSYPVWTSHTLVASAPCLGFLAQLRRVCLYNLCNYTSNSCSLLSCLPLSFPGLKKHPFPKLFYIENLKCFYPAEIMQHLEFARFEWEFRLLEMQEVSPHLLALSFKKLRKNPNLYWVLLKIKQESNNTEKIPAKSFLTLLSGFWTCVYISM